MMGGPSEVFGVDVTLVFPQGAWEEFRRRTRLAEGRRRLYENPEFRALWAAGWEPVKAKAMCDLATELGEEPQFARAVVRDITGVDPCARIN
jgi:hypothetical protein